MNHKRPVNLNLASLQYPPMAIVSILHRVSGIVLFLLLPLMIYFLGLSLASEASFDELKTLLSNPFYKCLLWGFSTAFTYHVIAGIRHLSLDLGFGEHLSATRNSARAVLFLSVVSAIFLGLWIC